MPARVSIPVRLGLQLSVDGRDHDPEAFRVVPIQMIQSFRTTNIVTMGSAKASFVVLHKPKDEWLYRHLANDVVTLLASIGGSKGTPKQYMIWKGLQDNPQHSLSLTTGSTFPIDASTMYKRFEVQTEGDFASGNTDFAAWIVSNGSLPASKIIDVAADKAGFPPGPPDRQIDTTGPDIRSVQTPIVGLDASALPGLNHQFVSFSNVIASAAQMVGRELFTNEQGQLIYRLSHYEDPPVGTIRKEWVITPIVSIDSDVGLANEVRVNYSPVELNVSQGRANAPANYPMSHYGIRQLNIAAPWIMDPASAQWYADWILSWAMHNTRPGMVTLAFAPDIVCGECYILPLPRPTVYYVMSVVHNYVAGQAPTTTLGLSYGREIGAKKWFTLPAPTDFGGQFSGAAGALAPVGLGDTTNLPTGANWRITHYTPAGLNSSADRNGNTYLTGKYLYNLYEDYYLRSRSDPTQHLYASVRECAIDPDYVIPELSLTATDPAAPAPQPIKLTKGDMLILKSNGLIVEVGDTIGTDATSLDAGGNVVPTYVNGAKNPAAVGKNGRQLDIFYWDDTGVSLPEFDSVEYLYVQATGMPKPAFWDLTDKGVLPAGTTLGKWTYGGAVASTAAWVQASLLADGNSRNRVAPGNGQVALFCHANGLWYPSGPANPHSPPTPEENAIAGDCQCTMLVKYSYSANGVKLGNVPYAKDVGNPDGWILNGLVNVTGQLPQSGDILVFDPSQGEWEQGDITGHVAVVHDVTAPANNSAGSVTVCQSNVTVRGDGLPWVQTFPVVTRGGRPYVTDNVPNTFGPVVKSLLRYGGGGTT